MAMDTGRDDELDELGESGESGKPRPRPNRISLPGDIIDWLRQQGRPIYDMDILKPTEEEEEKGAQSDEPADELYDQAVALVAESRQASISMVQRRLRIGYNRAARLVEKMESEGIVGPPDGVRGRQVLIESHL